MQKKQSKQTDFLIKLGATPTEIEIFSIINSIYNKKSLPLSNGDIVAVYGTHRTNIRNHLSNMIRKGIVKRHRHRFYIPSKSF